MSIYLSNLIFKTLGKSKAEKVTGPSAQNNIISKKQWMYSLFSLKCDDFHIHFDFVIVYGPMEGK